MSTAAWAAKPLRERWLQRRDRWIADPAFRDRASRWPGTRGMARRQAGEIFDLMAGFVYSQVLYACVKQRLFDRLAAGPMSLQALAAAGGLPEEGMARLLDAAEALELVRRVEDEAPSTAGAEPAARQRAAGISPASAPSQPRFALGRLGGAMAANPALEALVLHHAALYADLEDPMALLASGRGGGRLARYWSYATAATPGALPQAEVAPYSAVMSVSQALIARQVLDAYPVHRHGCLLDVGGGEGAFLSAALAEAPALRGMLCDLPAVAERARARLAAAGLGERASAFGGDFKRDPLPRGADLVSLVRVLYDHDDEPALRLLVAVREALAAGGTVLVAEPLARTRGAERMGAAYFGMYLWAMGSGRVRSAAEHIALLREAGFRHARERRTTLPLQSGLVVARAP
jgi:demethylspheroidene O-methyltransferase